jgi:hypothetical protein
MPVSLTAAQWLIRAEDTRLDAEAITNPAAKRTMLLIAAGYERLAAHAAALARSDLPHE